MKAVKIHKLALATLLLLTTKSQDPRGLGETLSALHVEGCCRGTLAEAAKTRGHEV